MEVSYMTWGLKWAQGGEKKSKWNLEKQLWGHGFLAQGANLGATCWEVRRAQRAGAEVEEGVEEGSGHGWSDSGGSWGEDREGDLDSGWAGHAEVVWMCGTMRAWGLGGRGRKRERGGGVESWVEVEQGWTVCSHTVLVSGSVGYFAEGKVQLFTFK